MTLADRALQAHYERETDRRMTEDAQRAIRFAKTAKRTREWFRDVLGVDYIEIEDHVEAFPHLYSRGHACWALADGVRFHVYWDGTPLPPVVRLVGNMPNGAWKIMEKRILDVWQLGEVLSSHPECLPEPI